MKKCCRCNQGINETKDRWVNVRDFDKGQIVGDKDMHLICWKNMFKEGIIKALQKKAKEVMELIKI